MEIKISQIKFDILDAFYKKKYRGKCVAFHKIFSLEYYQRDKGLQKPPYFLVEYGMIEKLIKKHRNKIGIPKQVNEFGEIKSGRGVLLIQPGLIEWTYDTK